MNYVAEGLIGVAAGIATWFVTDIWLSALPTRQSLVVAAVVGTAAAVLALLLLRRGTAPAPRAAIRGIRGGTVRIRNVKVIRTAGVDAPPVVDGVTSWGAIEIEDVQDSSQ